MLLCSGVRAEHLGCGVSASRCCLRHSGPPLSLCSFPVSSVRKPARRRMARSRMLLFAAFVLCFWALSSVPGSRVSMRGGLPSLLSLSGRGRTLVVYVYSFTDEEYERNLLFFLEHGVSPDDGCDYVLVMQEGAGVLRETRLPPLPPNVRLLSHPNSCFDWGTFGWVTTSQLDTSRYRYLILLNSSVRGPFLPSYWPADRHWTSVLTSRLSDGVKMVGATISCEASWKGGVLTGEKRQNPHVQSYLLAMDQVRFVGVVGWGGGGDCLGWMWCVEGRRGIVGRGTRADAHTGRPVHGPPPATAVAGGVDAWVLPPSLLRLPLSIFAPLHPASTPLPRSAERVRHPAPRRFGAALLRQVS